MYNLFLDDVRHPSTVYNYTKLSIYNDSDWVIIRNYKDFVFHITTHGLPNIISFDHDLADINYDPETQQESFVYNEKTGYDCAKWLVEYCLENEVALPKWAVHSQNPVGKKNIESVLISYIRIKPANKKLI